MSVSGLSKTRQPIRDRPRTTTRPRRTNTRVQPSMPLSTPPHAQDRRDLESRTARQRPRHLDLTPGPPLLHPPRTTRLTMLAGEPVAEPRPRTRSRDWRPISVNESLIGGEGVGSGGADSM